MPNNLRFAEFRRFCRGLVLDNRKPFNLEPFQRDILADFFGGTPQTVVVIPKGNGKTTLLGALGLWHLLETDYAECLIAAASRDQAGWMMLQAAGLVQRSGLEQRLLITQREIRRKDGLGRIRVIASDVDKTDGLIYTLGLIDELHRHRNLELYGQFRDGIDKRNGQMVTISTAGTAIKSPLGQMRLSAHALPSFRRTDVYNHAKTDALAWHEYCLEDTDDLRNLKLVKAVNPRRALTQAKLKRRRDDPSTTPGQWARFACNVWTEGEDPWIEPVTWDRLRLDVGGVTDGEPVWVGLRFGVGAGIAVVAARDEKLVVRAEILPPPPGGRVAFRDVDFTLRRICERYDVVEIAYDHDQLGPGAGMLEEAGLPMIEIPQRPKRLAQSTAAMWRVVSGGLLGHDGDPELRAQVLAGRTKETMQGWHLVPTAQTSALIALAVAIDRATEIPMAPAEVIAL